MEEEFARYMEAVFTLEQCGLPKEQLAEEKAQLYEELAEINRRIRAERKTISLCKAIREGLPRMEQNIQSVEYDKTAAMKRERGWR